MSNEFDTQEEFFDAYDETRVIAYYLGEQTPGVTVEEMYQHFRARMMSDMSDDMKALMDDLRTDRKGRSGIGEINHKNPWTVVPTPQAEEEHF